MRLGILGHPIEHSLSPKIFKILGEKYNKSLSYDIINVSPEEFDYKVLQSKYDGLNITFPYKEKILDFATNFNLLVSRTRCANTIVLKDNISYNTDVEGFESSLNHFDIDLKDKTVLVCGGGAAARSILQVICHVGAKKVQIKLRDIFKYDSVVKHFLILYPDVEFSIYNPGSTFDVVINTTTIGLTDENKDSDFFKDLFKETQYAYDLNYKKDSPFLEAAKGSSAKLFDGKVMLMYQALFAFEKWFHKIEDKQSVVKELEQKLKED